MIIIVMMIMIIMTIIIIIIIIIIVIKKAKPVWNVKAQKFRCLIFPPIDIFFCNIW